MVAQMQCHMTPDDARFNSCARRRIGVHFNPDRQCLRSVRRQARFVRKSGEPDKCGRSHFPVADFDFDPITLPLGPTLVTTGTYSGITSWNANAAWRLAYDPRCSAFATQAEACAPELFDWLDSLGHAIASTWFTAFVWPTCPSGPTGPTCPTGPTGPMRPTKTNAGFRSATATLLFSQEVARGGAQCR